MHVRPLRIDDNAEMHAYYLATRAAATADNPDRPVWTEEVMTGFIREPSADERVEVWLAVDDDEPVLGGGVMFVPQLDNLDKVYMGVEIAPQHQRRGAGTRVVETLVERAVSHGRTTLLLVSTIPFDGREDHGYRRFAERHGFAVASVEVSRRCDLPLPDEQLQAWIDEAAPHHADYRIETYTEIPDRLLPSVCHLGNQLALDAPTGDIEFEAEQLTPELRREHEERGKRQGVHKLETVAVDRDGQAVALTTIGVVDGDPGKAHQWITIVQREHRGHRLGLAVKAANLRALQQAYPDRTAIFTQNNESNGYMVSINEQFGFRPIELCVEFQRLLTPGS